VNQENPEDLTILAVLEAPDGGMIAPPERPDETAETLARLYTEVLGLLPYELAAPPPPPALKQRVMATITGEEETQEIRDATPAAPVPPPRQRLEEPAAAPSGEARIPRPAAAPVLPLRTLRTTRRWPLALAACLALIFAGLSGVLGYLVSEQRGKIDSLEARLAEGHAMEDRMRQMQNEMRQARSEMQEMRQSFSLVTGPQVKVAVLMPSGPQPVQPQARGNLFVASDNQHWYLSLRGLASAAPDQRYQLWWITSTGPVSGSVFTVQPGQTVQLSSPTMPGDTRGAMVTMEPVSGSTAPSGPEVLRSVNLFQLS
jgi:hypothetical protein